MPSKEEGFHEIHYVELEERAARKVVSLGNEIASLQIHPLIRKKNFSKIVELKDKFQLQDNNAEVLNLL